MADKKKYKALALDLDGTLLNTEHAVSEKNKEALEAARACGTKLVIVTGRTLEEIRAFDDCLNRDGERVIVQGGGSIIYHQGNRLVADYSLISLEDRRKLLSIAEKYDFSPLVYFGESAFSRAHQNQYHRLYEEMMSHRILYVEELAQMAEKLPVAKISMLADPKVIDLAERDMLEAGLEVTWGRSFDFGMDICLRGKRQALMEVMDGLGVGREEVIAVGDSENDLEMVEYAGLGVAMENGTERLKSAADFVTFGNNQDGVAYAIEKFILNEQ